MGVGATGLEAGADRLAGSSNRYASRAGSWLKRYPTTMRLAGDALIGLGGVVGAYWLFGGDEDADRRVYEGLVSSGGYNGTFEQFQAQLANMREDMKENDGRPLVAPQPQGAMQ